MYCLCHCFPYSQPNKVHKMKLKISLPNLYSVYQKMNTWADITSPQIAKFVMLISIPSMESNYLNLAKH